MEIRKLHKQHNSKVVTVPPAALAALGADVGDHLLFEVPNGNGAVVISKVQKGVTLNVGNSKNQHSKNKGGKT